MLATFWTALQRAKEVERFRLCVSGRQHARRVNEGLSILIERQRAVSVTVDLHEQNSFE